MRKSFLFKIFFASLLIISSFILFHYFFFYNSILSYKPLSVVVESGSKNATKHFSVIGVTPFDKQYHFPETRNPNERYLPYAFLKNLQLTIDPTINNNDFSIKVTSGKKTLIYSKEKFFEQWVLISQKDTTFTYIPPDVIFDNSFTGSFFSVFLWPVSQVLIFSLTVLLMLILVLLNTGIKRILTQLFLNKKAVFFSLFYLLLFYFFVKEILRYKLENVEGINWFNMCVFMLSIFVIVHAFFELIFFLFRLSKNYKQKIRLSLLSLFFIIAVVEMTLRSLHIYATHSEKVFRFYSSSMRALPNNHYLINPHEKGVTSNHIEFIHKRTFNSDGLPDLEHIIEKDSSTIRIAAFGDSFTEGVGVDFDSTWVSFLNRKMTQKFPEKPFEFFNAGISGSDPFVAYMLLQDKILKYHPDIVLLAVNTTDVSDYFFRGGFERFKEDGSVAYKSSPNWEWVYAYSFFSRFIIHNALGYDRHFIQGSEIELRTDEALKAIYEAVEKFKSTSIEHNFKFAVVLHPQLIELIEGKYLYPDFISIFSKNDGFGVVDVLAYFKNRKINTKANALRFYWPQDKHHNAKGYEMMADAIFEFIKSNPNFVH